MLRDLSCPNFYALDEYSWRSCGEEHDGSHLIDDSIKYFKTKRVILVIDNVTVRKERIYF